MSIFFLYPPSYHGRWKSKLLSIWVTYGFIYWWDATLDDVSSFNSVPQAPPDVIFNLTAQYKADTDANKINVGVGAFRTDELKPYVLPVVKKVCIYPAGCCMRRTRIRD